MAHTRSRAARRRRGQKRTPVPGAPRVAQTSDPSIAGPVLFCDGKRPHQHVVYPGNAQCPVCRGFAARVVDDVDQERVLRWSNVPRRPVREVPVPEEQLPMIDRYLQR